MLNVSRGLKISGATLLLGVMSAMPAQAQIGGVTGAVDGNLDGALSSSSTIGTQVKTPAPNVRIEAPVGARISSRTPPRSSGTHYHGGYAHDHRYYGDDYGFYGSYSSHYHDDRHSHAHGYASVRVEINSDRNKQPVGPMLTYGQQVYSKKGKDLGSITALTRTQSGTVTQIYVDGVPKPIPVDTLSAEGDILKTSLKKKKLK
jgi:hypothetical protein